MATLDRGALRKLADWTTDDLPVTSLHLDVDGRHSVSRAELLTRLDDLLKSVDAARWDRRGQRSVTGDLDRIRRFVRDEFDRSGVRGLAVFSASGAELWEDIAIARGLRDRIEVAPRPYLLPLENVLESMESFAVAVADRERARLFFVEGDRPEELTEFTDDVPGWHDQGGWSQSRFQRHIKEHVQRHLKRIADVLLRLYERRPFDHLVLGGPEELLSDLERELHDYVGRRIVDRTPMSLQVRAVDVADHCRRLEEAMEERRERDTIYRLVSEVEGRTGRAVAGVRETIGALEAGRVETLVVQAGISVPGARCPSCGHLDVDNQTCAACGAGTRPTDQLEEEIVEEALRRGCRVDTVVPAPSLEALGGIGALLRF